MEWISYSKPSITPKEHTYALDAVQNGWGSNCYKYILEFERAFADFVGCKFAISTSSCTGALHMGLHALGIQPGDEIIVPNTTWMASAAPIIYLGATPIFVDIDETNWCIDVDHLEKAITPRTKAIIAVHLYGNVCDMNKLMLLGNKYKIPVIEDAAEAIGSSYYGQNVGSIGSFGVFSFHGSKTLTTGEGGMFVTNDSELYERVFTLSNHGRKKNETKQFWADEVGFKYKMSNVQAAIGLAQIERVDELVNRKRIIFDTYKSLLNDPRICLNHKRDNCTSGYWMPTFLTNNFDSFKLSDLQSRFKQNKIDARVIFWPLSEMNFAGRKAFDQDYFSEKIHLIGMNLPSYHDMTDDDIARVCNSLLSYLDSL